MNLSPSTPGTSGRPVADIALVGGRVIDPETDLDAIRSVGITGGTITAVETEVPARATVDVSGQVVAPGFIDLHSHAQSLIGARLQALDGVTTALDLEAGRYPLSAALDEARREGRPINFGYSASWSGARAARVLSRPLPSGTVLPPTGDWATPWSGDQLTPLIDDLDAELDSGALGIGVLLGYAPAVTRAEYLALARLAERRGVATFTHTRYISDAEPGSSEEGVLEVIAAAAATGAAMHVCHLNSSAGFSIERIVESISRAQDLGVPVTAEAYPYGSGATAIGAAFLEPANLPRMHLRPEAIFLLDRGRPVRDEAELIALRSDDPTIDVITHWADETLTEDRHILQQSLLLDGVAIASDAMNPLLAGTPVPGDVWPLPPATANHPRSLGCFGKVFRWLVRELGVLTLSEAVRRCTLVPADILAGTAPVFRRKGRVQPGCDADLVVFDPERFADRATDGELRTSRGVRHLYVAGTSVISDGRLDQDALPGRAIVR